MHLLTGLYSPTSGTAKVNGIDIRESITKVRSQIGFTPQYNVLFNGMTVKEHLWFYSRLKGIDNETTRASIEKMIDETDLREHENEHVEKLSSGLQRKLSVAIAFVGNSKIVILDEPSAGVDPAGRRSIWDVLLKYKKDRTIVISTHYMDEADILSDRIAIISEGKLIAHGTPAYLKKKFGQGYYLTVCKNTIADSVESKDGQDNLIRSFITQRFKSAELIENNSSEITYSIPNKPESTQLYSGYFQEIEANYERLGISRLKLTDTVLEEIFMKLTDKSKLNKQMPIPVVEEKAEQSVVNRLFSKILTSNEKTLEVLNKETLNSYSEFTKCRIDSKCRSMIQQFYALIVKRFHRIKRNKKGLLAETVLPLVFVGLALLFSNLTPSSSTKPVIEIHPWHYSNQNMVFMSYANPGNETDMWGAVLEAPSLGTRCIKDHRVLVDNKKLCCDRSGSSLIRKKSLMSPRKSATNYTKNHHSKKCYLITKLNNCENSAYTDLDEYTLPTRDILYNMTGRNVSDWLLETEFSENFFQKRYGGYEINLNSDANKSFSDLKASSRILLNSLDRINEILEFKDGNNVHKFVKYLSAFENSSLLAKKNIKVWYNQKGFHSNVAYLNNMNNMLLRANLQEATNKNQGLDEFDLDPSEHGIVAFSEPMPLVKGVHAAVLKKRLTLLSNILQKIMFLIKSVFNSRVVIDLFVSIFIMFALAYIPAGFLLHLLEERENSFKQLQFISGVKPYIYWLANYVWDLFNYLFPCIICLLLFIAFNVKAYTSSAESITCVFLLFFLYGWSCIPFMYPMNYLFKTASTSFVYSSSINVFIGLATITISTVLGQLIEEKVDVNDLNNFLKNVFICLFPHYCLGQGLFDMSIIYYTGEIKQSYGYHVDNCLFKYNNIGRNLIFMFLQGIFYFTVNLLIEYNFFIKPKPRNTLDPMVADDVIFHEQDVDVLNEKERVMSKEIGCSSKYLSHKDNSLQMETRRPMDTTDTKDDDYVKFINLKKVYKNFSDSKQTMAVNSVTMGIKKGECFGLIGFNGAGKTTTFKMMTGHVPITSGEILINGLSVSTQVKKIQENIGYCPQTNAIIPLLTAREHLVLFARLRSIPEKVTKLFFVVFCLCFVLLLYFPKSILTE
jgi:ATP-binding cassette subfamily A (ABC1) protein 1